MTAMTAPEGRYYAVLGERIRAARQRAGLSQRQLAYQLDLRSGVAIHHWERAENRLNAWQLTQLDRIFGESWR